MRKKVYEPKVIYSNYKEYASVRISPISWLIFAVACKDGMFKLMVFKRVWVGISKDYPTGFLTKYKNGISVPLTHPDDFAEDDLVNKIVKNLQEGAKLAEDMPYEGNIVYEKTVPNKGWYKEV